MRILFERSVQLRRSVWKSEKSMCCGQIFKRPWSYKNKPKVQKVPLKLDSTSSSGCKISNCKLLSLCLYWWQLQKNNQFQNYYCKFMYKNYILAWWVLQNRVDWKNQWIKTILLSLVIEPYAIFFHEVINPYMYDYIHTYIYIFTGEWVWETIHVMSPI